MKEANRMNLELTEKCYITFPSDKGTAQLLTQLAHLQGTTQPKLLQQICQDYIANTVAKIMAKMPKEQLNELLDIPSQSEG